MTCTPQALVNAAICYTKFHKHDLDAMGIYLMCQWASHLSVPFQFAPDGALRSWTDSGGAHTGSFSLATFLSTADLPTVTILSFGTGAVPALTSIIGLGNLPLLHTFTSVKSDFTTIDFSGNTNLIAITIQTTPEVPGAGSLTSITGLASNPNLSSLIVRGQALDTINVLSNTSLALLWLIADAFVTLNVSGLPALTNLSVASNFPLTQLNITGDFAIVSLDVSGCGLLNGNIIGP